MSVTWIAADNDPAAAGLNATEKVQLAPAARLLPQVLDGIRNEDAPVPVDVIEEMVSAAVPVFFSVTVCELEVVPTVVVGKLNEVGLNVTIGPADASFTRIVSTARSVHALAHAVRLKTTDVMLAPAFIDCTEIEWISVIVA